MAIYGIADLHMDSSGEKPMDVFGANWQNHVEKIFESWKSTVDEDDIVLIPGDISWALKLREGYEDLKRIDSLPGKKIISKGNHDYWWETKSKLLSLELETIHFLYNDSYTYGDVAIGGTRGWAPKDSDEFGEHDEKVFERELSRLDLSFSTINKDISKKIALIHYPPFNFSDRSPNEFVDVMVKHGVQTCLYGHLHGDGHRFAFEGSLKGIDFHCVSCDFLEFKLKKIF